MRAITVLQLIYHGEDRVVDTALQLRPYLGLPEVTSFLRILVVNEVREVARVPHVFFDLVLTLDLEFAGVWVCFAD